MKRLNDMKQTVRVTAGLVAAGLVAAGCGSASPAGTQPPAASRGVAFREPAASPRPYGAADTSFGMNVLGAWCREDPQANLVLSPSSLASGLGMAYLGARGGTARAMAGVLRLPATGRRVLPGLRARATALRGLDGPGVTVAQTDQVWADPSLRTRASYLNAVATGYDAGIRRVPLLRQPAQAAQEINSAIAAATRGHITNLLSPQSLNSMGWVLTDALYLHAAWKTAFQTGQTRTGPFISAAGQPVSALFMHGGPFRTAQADGWTAVSLPYKGGKLAMTALLPAAGAGACPTLSPAAMRTITAGLAAPGAARNLIGLPKVSLSSKINMDHLLGTLGMGVAFSPAANFTGLSPQACCIGLVEHAATLQVGEKGTIGAAATATGVEPTALPAPPKILFDRPYLMLVTDTATGEPLFLARVADPAAH